jgi:chromate transporter
VAQIMPGPNVINLAVTLGDRYFGWRGALTGLAGMLAVPLVVVLVLALVYSHYATNPHAVGALRGMGAVAAGLITGTAVKLMPALKKHALGVPLCVLLGAATFGLVALLRLPLAWVLIALGALSSVLTWRRLP